MTWRTLAGILITGGLMLQAADIPRPAPDFMVKLPDGKQLNLNQYKGKVVCVEFLLVTCPHCQKTSQTLTRLQREYGPRGFQAIGVSIDPAANTQSFIAQYNVGYPVGVAASREAVYSYLQHSIMNPNFYVPQVVFIDRSGQIREQRGGTDPYFTNEEANLRTSIEKLLNEGAAKKTSPAGARSRKTS